MMDIGLRYCPFGAGQARRLPAFGQAPNPTPTPVAPLDAVQDETMPGAPAHGLGIGSSRLDGHSGPLAAFTRRGHGFLSADGPLARQGIRNGNLRLSRATRRHQPNVPVGSIDPFARPSPNGRYLRAP